MAIYHLSATPVQRSKGHSAVAGAAYRAGERLLEEKTGLTHDYQRKRGIVESQIIAPDHAPQWVYNRESLWNAAERAEKRRDAQPAREIRLGLPHELTDEQRADLVFNYARDMFVSEGMIADISLHRPDRHGDQRNDHAHILLTMRELDGDQFSTRKNRDWNKTETLEYWREQWAQYQNDALEDAGSSARVDHRSYEDRGINQEPTHHLGKDASGMERAGIPTRIGDENREIEEHNAHIKAYYEAAAQVESEINAELARLEEEAIRAPGKEEIHSEAPALLSWSELQKAAQSPFNDEVTRKLNESREETGEVKEYGLGHNWYDRTTAMYENVYGTIEESITRTVETVQRSIETVQGYWQQFIGRENNAPQRSNSQRFTGKDTDTPEPEEYERDR